MNPSAFVTTPTPSLSNWPQSSTSQATNVNGVGAGDSSAAPSGMDADPSLLASTSASSSDPTTFSSANDTTSSLGAPPTTQPEPFEEPAPEPKTAKERAQDQRDVQLAELLEMMDEWQPIIPDEVTDYFLQKNGFETDDPRVKRLLALAAQRFVSSIAADSFQYARARTAASKSSGSKAKGRTRTVLTMDDLSAALKDYGVGADRAAYYL
ncbi:BZ3500_MvSof-1268-A1-R1_Chr2-3g05258 [Microbotryum saponariae]|uniref:BZ3500_MvSof-1268-A1-R1_Chr2-3g05258 protein n=1 Tax=Microbotryum saponariae TaxID=289078 RepID=A0A2X0M0T9_9BASI|nr:BZ3500_MvSof-1268-A1-R1_Chr2-3g05258 [Microbotryum saponariae]SDA01084.1 BZ3501_MvSof-1269-A2-R1_Chr2-2g04931 [Microbotryum saponariae]